MPITTHRLDGMTLAKEKEGFIFWAMASAGYPFAVHWLPEVQL